MNRKSTRRKKGSGSLLERSGRWVMRWREDGRIVQEATPFKVGEKGSRAKAEELLEERTKIHGLKARRDQLAVLIAEREDLEERIRNLERKATPVKEGLKLGGLVDAWERSPRRKDCSEVMRARYAAQLQAFVDWAGHETEFAAVDDAMAERYALALGARTSGNTYNKHMNALTAAWRALARSEGVGVNPWADLPRKRLETHVRRALTQAEVAKVLKVAEGEVKGLIEIGLRTGLRMGDAVRLRWENFSKGGETVEVKTSKTGAVVRLPARGLWEALGGRSARRGLAVRTGQVLPKLAELYGRDDSAVSKLVRRTFEKAGIETRAIEKGWSQARPEASFHSLRHTFVTRAIEAGVPAAMVRALVGHSRLAMTEHYTHVGGEAVLEAFRRSGIA